MRKINARTQELTDVEIAEFFTKHLPYRIDLLESHNLKGASFQMNDRPIRNCLYESMQIACRMFLEFMGLGITGETIPQLKESTKYYSVNDFTSYEVKIIDLGGKFVEIGHPLIKKHSETLAHAYMCGNRATAHLTYNTPFQPKDHIVAKCPAIIRELLYEHLEKPTGKTIGRIKQ